MISLDEINSEFQEDIDAVKEWSNEIYKSTFSEFFKDQRELYNKLKSKTCPITDEELELILTTIPLELFTVSEILSQFKISTEVVKIKVKQLEADIVAASTQKAMTNKKEEASLKTLEHKLLATVYNAVAVRVSSEIDFSRELSMGAKKIWDARRSTDSVNPVSPVVTDDASALPEYTSNFSPNKTYVR